jgi:ATP-binding cassette, subfamily F, member 3
VLDEPTNHLDMQSKDILKSALLQFKGTIIIVSHDRDFLQGLTEKVFEFKNRKIKEFIGDVYDFIAHRNITSLKELEAAEPSNAKEKEAGDSSNKVSWEQKKQLERDVRKTENQIGKCEKDIARLEKEKKELEEALSNPEKNLNKVSDSDLFKQYEAIKIQLLDLESLWEELHLKLEKNK